MSNETYKSEIRNSIIRDLIEKVRKRSYGNYLISLRLEKIRFFQGAQINFDFPVTALIGPNGGGKSTILGATACAYSSFKVETFFQKSRVGDDSMDDWQLEYELVDRRINNRGTVRLNVAFKDNRWSRNVNCERTIRFFSINRTVPAGESSAFTHKKLLRVTGSQIASISTEPVQNIEHIKTEAERILGKSLSCFQLLRIKVDRTKIKSELSSKPIRFEEDDEGNKVPVFKKIKEKSKVTVVSNKLMFVGSDGVTEYSEFNFGAGESSIIRLVADAESLPENSLILIEEIENGLHPVAVRRLVEYLIDIANRKRMQVVFTTHSDNALMPLPPEAIWASMDGKVQQGKLSIELLRVVSGRIDKRLAIFVEDEFAKSWIEAILREKLGECFSEIGVYPVSGDGNAVLIHLGQIANPAVTFHSLCFIDGDSRQKEDVENRIYRLPGEKPESTIFNSVLDNLDNNIALLTVACQRASEKQEFVANEIKKVSHTNRDPHLLFNQIGLNIGFVPESIIKGAFLSIWIQENPHEAKRISNVVKTALELPPKA